MFREPPVNPDDTQPTQTMRLLDPEGDRPRRVSFLQILIGLVSLVIALGLLIGAAVLYFTPPQQVVVVVTSTPTPPNTQSDAVQPTITPTAEPVDSIPTTQPNPSNSASPLSIEAQTVLLSQPVTSDTLTEPLLVRDIRDPYTIIPDRPRIRVELYTIEKGDSINAIAERFGLQPETLAWSNDRSLIWKLTPGAILNIMPVDGVYHQAVGSATVREIASQYGVNDPAIILQSEYNNLQAFDADTVLPSGVWVVVPGGKAEAINFSPVVETISGSGSGTGGESGGGLVSYDPSSPGTCGALGAGVASGWVSPLSSYTFMRGFSSFHTGVDLAAPVGTPVYAANSGRVIFAGRSNYGYGIAVVISHGPFSTLYGHLSSENVSCGQLVSGGQVVGAVGLTGNTNGPHLHFEIMYNGIATNPTDIMPF